MRAYYNDNDPKVCDWLKQLIEDRLIPDGDVDNRSIVDVQADDLKGYNQVHLFAGIAGWPLTFRLCGIPDSASIWSGSCPCPPFSCAGKKQSCPQCQGRNLVPHPWRTAVFVCCGCGHSWVADGRHLWPEMWRLIDQCRPPIVFGEQVASSDGFIWLAGVRATLEGSAYRVGAADLCAAGAGADGEGRIVRGGETAVERLVIGAPHIRQRIVWVADTDSPGWRGTGRAIVAGDGGENEPGRLRDDGDIRMADAHRQHSRKRANSGQADAGTDGRDDAGGSGKLVDRGMGDPERRGLEGGDKSEGEAVEAWEARRVGLWSDFALVECADRTERWGKVRRVEPGTFPLVTRVPAGVGPGGDPSFEEVRDTREARVTRLKGYGNAINIGACVRFVNAYIECRK